MTGEISTTEAAADADLLAAARRGDERALEALLIRYQPHLYRFGLRMCGNDADAGDVVQESLLSMARSLGSFRGESSIASWLYTIARRFCIKKRRRSKFAPAHEESLDAPGVDAAQRLADRSPNPEQAAADREVARMLTAAIDRLEPSQREVLVLRDVEGLSAPEVARIVGASVEAVKSRLHRARASVRRALLPLAGLERSEPDRAPGCPDVVTLFSQHLEGDLNPGMCATLEAHLAGCDRCRGRCDGLKRTLALCRQLPTPAVPPAIASSLRAAIRTFVDSR